MFKKIIVPLDGSATAEVTIPYAAEAAARTGTDLILLVVKEPHDNRSDNMLQAYLDTIANDIRNRLKTHQTDPDFKQFNLTTRILRGNPAEEIVKFAESQDDSRLIMATHGQSGFSSPWALGSVTNKVTRAVTKPITLIRTVNDKPDIHKKATLQNLVVALDGSKAGEAALPYVKELAQMLKLNVTFLHVLVKELVTFKMIEVPISEERRNMAKEYLAHLVEDFQKSGISAKYEIWETRGDIGGEIVEYTQKRPVDLMVMVVQGHSGLKYWGIGSVTNKVINEGDSAVMIVKGVHTS